MSKKPNLKSLESLFLEGKNFELTDTQYEKKTGAALPKDKSYIIKKSALAKEAGKHGYFLDVIEKKVLIKKKWGSLDYGKNHFN